jgi:hypothetical protein
MLRLVAERRPYPSISVSKDSSPAMIHVERELCDLGNGLPVYKYGQEQLPMLRRSRVTDLEVGMSGIQLRRDASPSNYCTI